jgi:glycogen synthase
MSNEVIKDKKAIEVLTTDGKKSLPKKTESKITVLDRKKILYVASESAPFIATGGLAEVIGSLPKALALDSKYDVRVVLPLYSGVKQELRRKFSFLGNIYVPLGWRNQYCGIFSYEYEGVTFYFIDNEYYFKRSGCYGYYDDGERFAFFSRSALEILPFIDFYPDVLHCHDWQAALAAIYLKTLYANNPDYQKIRALFTIHNIEYQGKYSLDILGDLFGLPEEVKGLVEYDGCINLMKGAIECSERFSTVSPTYAEEIKTERFAHGLQDIIRKNSSKLTGILNGIDVISYDSATDKAIPMNSIGFFGLHAMTAGSYYTAEQGGELYEEKTEHTLKRLFTKDDYLTGFILIGATDRAGIYTSLIRDRIPLSSINFERLKKIATSTAFSAEKRKQFFGGVV